MQKVAFLNFLGGGVKLLELSATAVDDGSYKLLVDGTLSVSGAAADAESVGKELANLLEMLAEKTQLTPEFANDVSECTDSTKLYVLPDGYIYAYMTGESQEVFADVLAAIGYQENMRINSSGVIVEWTTSDADVTGYIPCKTGDIIRVKNMPIPSAYTSGAYWNQVAAYDSNKAYIAKSSLCFADDYPNAYGYALDAVSENDNIVQFTVKESIFGENVAYIVINAKDITDESEVYVNSTLVETSGFFSTGHAFVPADYEDCIIALEKETEQIDIELASMKSRMEKLEEGLIKNIPDYYTSHLEEKIDLINQVMEKAGRNKSSGLIYTDAHITAGNAWITPLILVNLYENTALNKTFFPGDLLGDPTELTHEYLKSIYAWRILIKSINQHSALGNHDNLHKGRNDSDIAKMVYAFLIAPEETPDMVMGDDFYYYIDDVCERTRYLYLDSGRYNLSDDETKFIIDALTSTKDGWHIVVVSHIWFQYTSAAAPTVGSINGYMQKALNLFDAYNSRESGSVTMMNTAYSYDFREAGGKVEFCVGGHIHVSLVVYSQGGIPVVLLPSDANQDRSSDHTDDCGTFGTITEVAVGALIADYDNGILTIVGIGRMQDRVIEL